MPNPIAIIDYQKCHPDRCDGGICAAMLECPNKVMAQETPYEFHFCHGCAKCVQACSFEAVRVMSA